MKKDLQVFKRELKYTNVFGSIKDDNGNVVARIKRKTVVTNSDDFISSLVATDSSKKNVLSSLSKNKVLYNVIDSRTGTVVARMDKKRNLYDLEGNYIGTLGNANYLNLYLHILTVLAIIAILLAMITLKSSTTKEIDSEIIITDTSGKTIGVQWNVFGEYEDDKVIYPEKTYIYIFTVRNVNDVAVSFVVDFDEVNLNNIPMRYRLSTYDGYLVGNEYVWVTIDDLVLDPVVIPAQSELTFALHWKWKSLSDEADTIIGNTDGAEYIINVVYTSTIYDEESK